MINKYLVNTKSAVFIGLTVALLACSDSSPNTGNTVEETVKTESEKVYNPQTLGAVIEELEQSIASPNANQKEMLTDQLVSFYGTYYQLFPNDEKTPEMIFKAGNQCVNLKRFDEALRWYNLIDVKYYSFQKRPEALYLQGFVYDTYKNEFGNAKEKYERLIKLYPNHTLAPQAKQSIENLGLTDEEIIRKFEANKK
tara:strand:+ start:59448 stop:60038 length:591 start_codon:yes stop_codon:yes gene_type:complete